MKKDSIPEGLTDSEAIDIWKERAGKTINASGRISGLARYCLTLQRVKKIEKIVEEEGLMVKGEHMNHAHPLLKILHKDLQILSRLSITLGLNQEVVGIEKWGE